MIGTVVRAAGDDPSWWPAWDLWGDAFLVALLFGASLPLLGVVLVLRQQMFVAAAVGQATAFAIAVALQCGLHAHAGGTVPLVAGLAAAVATSILGLRAMSARASTIEARNAWLFLAGGSGAMVVVASSPHGMQEVQRLMLSSLVYAGPGDVLGAGLGLGVVVLLAWTLPRRLAAWAIDPGTAAAHGIDVRAMDVMIGTCLGLVVGHAMAATGLAFTFGSMVLPVLCARELAGSLRGVCLWAPAIGASSALAGMMLGNRFDLPPGQAAVCVAAAAGPVLRCLRLRRSVQ